MKTTPYAYQLLGARALHRFGGRGLLADEMGLGKSLQALLYAERHPQARPVLIVCPAGLKFNWARECRQHFGWHAHIVEGLEPPKDLLPQSHAITIANYDILSPRQRKQHSYSGWLAYLKGLAPKLIILDEAHYLKNPRSARSRTVRELCQGVPHVLALTGTPIENKPIELWPVLNILYPREFPSYYGFGMAYCAPQRNRFSGGWDFNGSSNIDELRKRLQHIMIRRKKADVLQDLPPKQRHVVPLDIVDRGQYEEAEEAFLQWLARHKPEKLTKALKAEMLVKTGYLKRLAATLKLPNVFAWVDSFLAESEGKLLVFGVHRSILDQLEDRYRKMSVVVHGSVKGRERQEAVDQFQQRKEIRLFLGQIRAAGVGLNLTRAADVAFAEFDWVPAAHTQAEDRCYGRLSDLHGASSWWLTAENTIESRLVQILDNKQETANAVLDGQGKGDQLDIYGQLCKKMLEERR